MVLERENRLDIVACALCAAVSARAQQSMCVDVGLYRYVVGEPVLCSSIAQYDARSPTDRISDSRNVFC
jgi:hypothetical protein